MSLVDEPRLYISTDGGPALTTQESATFYVKTDVQSVQVTYIGQALKQNTVTSLPLWRIKRILSNAAGVVIEESWALNADNEVAFDQVYDDRATLFPVVPYSNTLSVIFDNASYASIGNESLLSFDRLDPFTVSCWFRLSAGTERILFSKQAGGNNEGYRVSVQGGNPRFHLAGGSAGNRIEVRSSETNINDGLWHHIAFIYDGTGAANGVSIYIDGAIDASPTIQNDTLTNSTINAIAAQISGRNGTSANFNGNMDEVSVYNTNLGGAQITEIYNNGTPIDLVELGSSNDCVGWWRMGEGSTFPTLPDEKGSLDALLVNAIEADIVEDTP